MHRTRNEDALDTVDPAQPFRFDIV